MAPVVKRMVSRKYKKKSEGTACVTNTSVTKSICKRPARCSSQATSVNSGSDVGGLQFAAAACVANVHSAGSVRKRPACGLDEKTRFASRDEIGVLRFNNTACASKLELDDSYGEANLHKKHCKDRHAVEIDNANSSSSTSTFIDNCMEEISNGDLSSKYKLKDYCFFFMWNMSVVRNSDCVKL